MGIGFTQFIDYLIGYHENNISFNHDMKITMNLSLYNFGLKHGKA